MYEAIINILSKFKELSASDNSTIQHFVDELLLLSFTSINQTLITQSQGLEKDFNYLQESMDKRLIHFLTHY